MKFKYAFDLDLKKEQLIKTTKQTSLNHLFAFLNFQYRHGSQNKFKHFFLLLNKIK